MTIQDKLNELGYYQDYLNEIRFRRIYEINGNEFYLKIELNPFDNTINKKRCFCEWEDYDFRTQEQIRDLQIAFNNLHKDIGELEEWIYSRNLQAL